MGGEGAEAVGRGEALCDGGWCAGGQQVRECSPARQPAAGGSIGPHFRAAGARRARHSRGQKMREPARPMKGEKKGMTMPMMHVKAT